MQNLKQILEEAEKDNVAIGHFNISDTVTLRAIFEAAQKLAVPIIIGTSEGERNFLGIHEAVALVRTLREQHNYPIFLNADHTYSVEKCKEAINAGYDAVIFDGAKLSIEENISQTKEVVEYAREKNSDILVEGELGYIGSSSKVLDEIPEGAAINESDLTSPEEAARYVKETGVDLLAPAIGNIHGMFKNAPNPSLNIERIKAIKEMAQVPLVLHGGSGIENDDFSKGIEAGIGIVHINTELRRVWRSGIEKGFADDPTGVAPYKLMASALDEMREVVYNRLTLFNKK